MKKKLILIVTIALAVIAVVAIGVFKQIESKLESLTAVEIPEVDMNQIEDGVYNGSYTAIPVAAEVSVTVKGHVITDIQILKHINGHGAPAEIITEKVIEAQSLQVDSISGATYSSKVILCAINNALLSADN